MSGWKQEIGSDGAEVFEQARVVAKVIDWMLKRRPASGFFAGGRICLSNNAAERALRGVALGRKAWLFTASDRGGQRAAFVYTLIVSANPRARMEEAVLTAIRGSVSVW